MAILPGSLDYLYHNGILPRIPYEAYEMTPMTPSGQAQLAGMGMGFGFSSAPLSYPSGMSGISQFNGSQYLQQTQGSHLYNTYTNPDTFVPRNNEPIKTGENFSIRNSLGYRDYGKNLDATTMAFGEEGKSFRKSILDVASKTKESVVNSPTWIKGLASVGIMIVTIGCLLKGKKVPTPRAPEKTIFQKFLSLFKK